jgi:CRP/FNR family transcriptional regulator, cyclic AMP receptor protein
VPGPAELLSKIGLFESLSERQRKRLAESLKERTLSEGDVILSEGKSGIGFFVIAEGTVTYNVDGKDVGSGGAGDYFGEIALIEDRPRMATVTAAADVTIYAMTRWEFRALSEEHPDIASGLRQVMAQRQSTEG